MIITDLVSASAYGLRPRDPRGQLLVASSVDCRPLSPVDQNLKPDSSISYRRSMDFGECRGDKKAVPQM